MSQAPRNARVMLKPQQVVTALRIMIKPLCTMLKVPRITLYRPRLMSQAPRIMLKLKAPRLSQASRHGQKFATRVTAHARPQQNMASINNKELAYASYKK
jgi:hypothetical protein